MYTIQRLQQRDAQLQRDNFRFVFVHVRDSSFKTAIPPKNTKKGKIRSPSVWYRVHERLERENDISIANKYQIRTTIIASGITS